MGCCFCLERSSSILAFHSFAVTLHLGNFLFFKAQFSVILEKEMATHSSILAWRILWTEELGGLQSTGRKESDTTERVHFHFHFQCHLLLPKCINKDVSETLEVPSQPQIV